MDTASARTGWDALPDRGGSGHLHDIRRGLHFLHRKKFERADARQVLEIPIITTICLLSSSLTIHFGVRALQRGNIGSFRILWFITLALGAIFLVGTGREWHRLIYEKGLTISTNLFGTTYYSLVGLHAFHVTVGLLGLTLVMLLSLAGKVHQKNAEPVDVFSLYWHFVDVVWVVVFTVVYLIGR